MADNDHIPPTKACKKCGEHKPLHPDHFDPQPSGKYGYTSRCRACRKAEQAALRARPDQRARQKGWRDAHKARVKEYNEAYRAAGYKSTAHGTVWRAANLERARKADAQRRRDRRAADPVFRMRCRIAARLGAMLSGKGGRRSEELLGFTMQELRAHIERQFTNGMGWEAFQRGEIEIDHIMPVASFRITGYSDPDFRACWGLANLRPMWSSANRSKGAKVLTLL